MACLNTKVRFGSLSIALHWLMLFVFVGLYLCVELHESFPKGSEIRHNLMVWHFNLGYMVFILVLMRIAVLFFGSYPVIIPELLAWQKKLAGLMHLSLYLLMIGMPIAGYLGFAAAGKTPYFLGYELPKLLETNKELAKSIFNIHETIGNVGYFLIGLHTLAALSHHYIQRDNTLTRMFFKRG